MTQRQVPTNKFTKRYSKHHEQNMKTIEAVYREAPPNHLGSPPNSGQLKPGTVDSEVTVKNVSPAEFFEADTYHH